MRAGSPLTRSHSLSVNLTLALPLSYPLTVTLTLTRKLPPARRTCSARRENAFVLARRRAAHVQRRLPRRGVDRREARRAAPLAVRVAQHGVRQILRSACPAHY